MPSVRGADPRRAANSVRTSLRDYALPRLGKIRVDAVTTADVMAMLLPIWLIKRETAWRMSTASVR